MSVKKVNNTKDDLGKGGVKFDGDKLRYDLVPPDAMALVAMVFTYGGVKYADRNWEMGMEWNRLAAACERHLNDWKMGNDTDETGLPHLAHAACSILMLLALTTRRCGVDDRALIDATTAIELSLSYRAMREAIKELREATRG
jgi:hypothetical protein